MVENYTEITQPALQERVRKRYRKQAEALQALGFRHLAYCLEALRPYSAIMALPLLVPMLLKREVLVFARPLRIGLATLLLYHSDPPAIALCMGMGVKIYTFFAGKTLLISSDFKSYAVPRPGSAITRLPPELTPAEAWLAHRKRALDMLAQGKAIVPAISFRAYVEMSRIEEDLGQYQ